MSLIQVALERAKRERADRESASFQRMVRSEARAPLKKRRRLWLPLALFGFLLAIVPLALLVFDILVLPLGKERVYSTNMKESKKYAREETSRRRDLPEYANKMESKLLAGRRMSAGASHEGSSLIVKPHKKQSPIEKKNPHSSGKKSAVQSERSPGASSKKIDYYHIGLRFQRQGHSEQAIRMYRMAIEENPSLIEAYNNLGNLYLIQKNDPESAIVCYQKGLEIDPNYAKLRNNLGIYYLEKGELEEAESEFKRAMSLDASFELPHYNLACLYVKKEQLEKAVAHLQKAAFLNRQCLQWVRMDPDLEEIRDNEAFKQLVDSHAD